MKFSIHKLSGYQEFNNKLTSLNDGFLTLEMEGEGLKNYALIELPEFTIGVIYEENSVYPKVKFSENNDWVFIGLDNCLAQISLKSKKLEWVIKLQTLFVDICEFPSSDMLIVIEEGGVSRHNYFGKKLWFYGTDLIQNYLVDSDTIIISQMDEGKLKLSTKSGKPI